MQYYYHPDHLGSSSYITNLDGEIVQHVEYVPFGEVFIEERNNSWNTPYLFNGKELDEETGLYYYGARYYNPRESVWLSVDPLFEKTMTPYQYTYQNPLKYTDPTGMKGEDIIIRGKDNHSWTIKAEGEDKIINVPVNLGSDKNIDLGLGNVDPERFAIGFTTQVDAGFSSGVGGNAGVELSVIKFTDSEYSNYNYVYAGVHQEYSLGAQASISASAGSSISIAYNASNNKIDPTSYAGITVSHGVSADVKYIVGGGATSSYFKGGDWKGVTLGVSVGVGIGANLGSGATSISYTKLLNDVKPTSSRSTIDRFTNTVNPVGSSLVRGILK